MIKVEVFRAEKHYHIHRNGTFTEGRVYIGRMSKDSNCYVLLSNEGYWIPVIYYTWARSGMYEFPKRFTKLGQFHHRSVNDLNKILTIAKNNDIIGGG